MLGDADSLTLIVCQRKAEDAEKERRLLRAMLLVALDGGTITVSPKDDPETLQMEWPNRGERSQQVIPASRPTWIRRLTSPRWIAAFVQALFAERKK